MPDRTLNRRERIRQRLELARLSLMTTHPDLYNSDRYYRAVKTTRERRVRQLERLLAEEQK